MCINSSKRVLAHSVAIVMFLMAIIGSLTSALAEVDQETWDKAYREMNAAYDAAYREMYNQWTPEKVLSSFVDKQKSISQDSLNKTVGVVNDLYNAANSVDWRMKYFITFAAGAEYGVDTGIATGLFLSDSKLGSALREATGYLLAFGQTLARAYYENKISRMAPTDLYPVASQNGYTLLASWGTLRDIVGEMGAQSIAEKAISVLESEIQKYIPTDHVKVDYLLGYFDPTDQKQMNKALLGQQYSGQSRALADRRREWTRMMLYSTYIGCSSLTIENQPVLSTEKINEVIHSLEGVVEFSEEDLANIYIAGPVELERVILKNGIGLTDEEIDYLRDETRPSVHILPSDYVAGLKRKAGDEESSRYDVIINALDMILEMVNNAEYSLTYPEAGSYRLYMLMDQDQNVVSQFLYPGCMIYAIGQDGSISVGPVDEPKGKMYATTEHKIIDIQGNILYQSQPSNDKDGLGSIIWYDLTPSGNIIRKTIQSNMQYGDYELLELVHPDGTAEELLRAKNITRIMDGDYYTDEIPFSYDTLSLEKSVHEEVIIDVRTGSVTKGKKQYNADDNKSSADPYADTRAKIDDDYILTGDKLIYRKDGKLFCDFGSVGGIKQIQQIGDMFWILSKTGYFYVMDKNLNVQSDEPIRLNSDLKYLLTDFGLLETEKVWYDDDNNYGWVITTRLYAANGSVIAEFDNIDIEKDLDTGIYGFIGNSKYGYYDLRTGHKLSLGEIHGNLNMVSLESGK